MKCVSCPRAFCKDRKFNGECDKETVSLRAYNKWNLGILKFASPFETNYTALQGIQFRPDCSVATDGRRLMIVDSVETDGVAEDQQGEFKPDAAKEGKPFVIESEIVKKLIQTLPVRKRKRGFPTLTVDSRFEDEALQKEVLFCALASARKGEKESQRQTISKVPVFKGTYPKWEGVLPKGEPKATIEVNGHLMSEIVKYLADMDGEFGRVTIKMYGDEDALEFEIASADTGQKARALLMPLSRDKNA